MDVRTCVYVRVCFSMHLLQYCLLSTLATVVADARSIETVFVDAAVAVFVLGSLSTAAVLVALCSHRARGHGDDTGAPMPIAPSIVC